MELEDIVVRQKGGSALLSWDRGAGDEECR